MELYNNRNEDAGNKHKGGGLMNMYKLAKPSLHLSPEQENAIEAILHQFMKERKTIKSSDDNNKDTLRAARQQARQQLMQVLSPEQKKIWRETKNTWRAQSEGPLK